MQRTAIVVVIAFGLSACAPAAGTRTTQTAVPSPTPAQSVDDLSEFIYFSDPSVPQYDPNSEQYAQFPDMVNQLGNAGIEAAATLAYAIRFPRDDAFLAAQSLLSMPAEVIATTAPILIDNLHDEKPEPQIYSVILLAAGGKHATCAVEEIARLLWVPDPYVRSAAALALEIITEQDLVASEYEIVIAPNFTAEMILPDTPEGKVVESARNWWNEQGSQVNWHSTYGTCDP